MPGLVRTDTGGSESGMTTVHVRRAPLDDERRGDLVFAGDLVVFAGVAGLDAFRSRVDELVRATLGDEPELAQYETDHDTYLDAVRGMQRTVRRDAEAHRLLLDAFRATGLDDAVSYWDWVHLRVLPSGPGFAGSGTGWHRDTWSSSLPAQTNWWTPIYPITAGRTITFAPGHWSRPVPNSSADWTPASEQLIPEPLETVDVAEQRVVVEPDDLLCFSGAQLHGTVPNDTGRARFSVEVRTVCRSDVERGRGAPAVDGTAPRTQYGWFRHVLDGVPLVAPAA